MITLPVSVLRQLGYPQSISTMPFDETIVALATPAGESAIAMVRLGGPLCQNLVIEIFNSSDITPRKATYAKFRDVTGKTIDKVIYIYFENDSSYTGEPMLEICCHGSPLIAQKIIEDLLKRKCRMAEPGEFTRTAFLNGKMDLSQAEAVIDLIQARSDKALDAARKQLEGSVGKRVNQLVNSLLEIIASIEAYIDFPEEDLPYQDADGPAKDLARLQEEINRLISTSQYSNLLHKGVKTVIVGPPNTGKSSLLNALTGHERVIVTDQPGTTRDYVEENTFLGSYFVRLIDTAGLREPGNDIEKLGIEKTREQILSADFHLFVIDTTIKSPTLSDDICNQFSPAKTIVVENKIDLDESRNHSTFMPEMLHCRLSALTGDGIKEFIQSFISNLEKDIFIPNENNVIVSARHADALQNAKNCVENALDKIRQRVPVELVASDLRGALDAMGQITGKIDNERILDKLFSRFCIGK